MRKSESAKIGMLERFRLGKGIILPKSWLDFLKEENQGQPIEAVAIEVTNVLRVSPIFKKVAEVPNE